MESSRAQKLADLPVEVFEQVRDGKMTRAQAERERKTAEKQAQMEKTAARLSTEKDVVDIRRCSCKELFASGIKPDAVITDPPYPEKFLPLFTELAESCKNVPLVAVMIGQTYFPDILSRLCDHLTYRWTLAFLTPGGQSAQQFPVKINAFWKPVLLFGKAAHWLGDVARSAINDNDKTHHHWGQSESGMTDLVERLTHPGQLVCDPFKGAGTTALASLALNRRFVGCDIDKKSVEQAKLRVRSSKGWETYGNEIQADQRGRNLGIAGSVAA